MPLLTSLPVDEILLRRRMNWSSNFKWTANDRLTTIWKFDNSDRIKREFIPAEAVSVLLYVLTTWTLRKVQFSIIPGIPIFMREALLLGRVYSLPILSPADRGISRLGQLPALNRPTGNIKNKMPKEKVNRFLMYS